MGGGDQGPAPAAAAKTDQPAPVKTGRKRPPQGLGYEKTGQCASTAQIPGGNQKGEPKSWQKPMACRIPAEAPKCRERRKKTHMMKQAIAEALPKFHGALEAGKQKIGGHQRLAPGNRLSQQVSLVQTCQNLGLLGAYPHDGIQQKPRQGAQQQKQVTLGGVGG